ncbi:MAG: hypothetical protein WC985_00330 [Thermoplasmata archaeon]
MPSSTGKPDHRTIIVRRLANGVAHVRLSVPEGPVRVEVDVRVGAKPDLRVVAVPLTDMAPRGAPRAFDHHFRIRIFSDMASNRPESNE